MVRQGAWREVLTAVAVLPLTTAKLVIQSKHTSASSCFHNWNNKIHCLYYNDIQLLSFRSGQIKYKRFESYYQLGHYLGCISLTLHKLAGIESQQNIVITEHIPTPSTRIGCLSFPPCLFGISSIALLHTRTLLHPIRHLHV